MKCNAPTTDSSGREFEPDPKAPTPTLRELAEAKGIPVFYLAQLCVHKFGWERLGFDVPLNSAGRVETIKELLPEEILPSDSELAYEHFLDGLRSMLESWQCHWKFRPEKRVIKFVSEKRDGSDGYPRLVAVDAVYPAELTADRIADLARVERVIDASGLALLLLEATAGLPDQLLRELNRALPKEAHGYFRIGIFRLTQNEAGSIQQPEFLAGIDPFAAFSTKFFKSE